MPNNPNFRGGNQFDDGGMHDQNGPQFMGGGGINAGGSDYLGAMNAN